MARVWIESDEWYPVFSIGKGEPYYKDEKWFEVDDAKLAEIARVFAEFDEIQQFLAELEGARRQ